MTSTGLVTNIQRCSTEDGPGIRTSVFFKGCPMKCVWCHNIETIDPDSVLVWYAVKCIGDQGCIRACPESALELTPDGMKINMDLCNVCGTCEEVCPTGAMKIMGTLWQSDDLIEELLRDKVFFTTSNGGVTLTGGEATYQSEFAIDVATGLQENGVHVALDTCGYCSEKVLREMLEHVDMVLYDLKHMEPEKHEEFTGVSLDRVLSNAQIIAESGKPVWIRTPVIPDHTDSEDNIRSIAKFIATKMQNVERYDLLAFNPMGTDKYKLFGLEYPLKDANLITEKTMERLAEIAKQEGISHVVWSGITKNSKISTTNDEQEEKPCAS